MKLPRTLPFNRLFFRKGKAPSRRRPGVRFWDKNDNHVGISIDINSLVSNPAETTGYYTDDSVDYDSSLGGKSILVWVDYDSVLGGKEFLHSVHSTEPYLVPPKAAAQTDSRDFYLIEVGFGLKRNFEEKTSNIIESCGKLDLAALILQMLIPASFPDLQNDARQKLD
ncbi:L-type lectin-domain containing receptor kinase S.4-like [Senna tora]|uniref:L-type lectin-domain containing receptor kinase S.4-like n=1 Tax=Senna tora TaxID=362788 RepID=A0A834XFB2_9FABA|nr:L-type lectin-domain containing receptor kinase S.4-like [Senna tora]